MLTSKRTLLAFFISSVHFCCCVICQKPSQELKGNPLHCLISGNDCVLANYSKHNVRLSFGAETNYFSFRVDIVSTSQNYNNELFEYYIKNKNSENEDQKTVSLVKIAVTVTRTLSVCSIFVTMTSQEGYLISHTKNNLNIDKEIALKLSLFLVFSEDTKTIEFYVKTSHDLKIQTFSQLHLPLYNNTFRLDQESMIEMANTKQQSALRIDKIFKYLNEINAPREKLPYCIIYTEGCAHVKIPQDALKLRQVKHFHFDKDTLRFKSAVRIKGSFINYSAAWVTFAAEGYTRTLHQITEIKETVEIVASKFELSGNFVRPLMASNSTVSLFIKDQDPNPHTIGSTNIYLEKDGTIYLLGTMKFKLHHLQTISINNLISDVSVIVEYPDNIWSAIVLVLCISLIFISTLFGTIVFVLIRRHNKRETESKSNNDIEEEKDDNPAYIYDDAFNFRKSAKCEVKTTEDIYFTGQDSTSSKTSVSVDLPVSNTERKVNDRVR